MTESRPPAKQRKKASSACVSCRARRTKCNIEAGQIFCNYCQRNNLQCIFQDDDERKKSASKAHISALNERVQMLEELLKGKRQQLQTYQPEIDLNNEKPYRPDSEAQMAAVTHPPEEATTVGEPIFQAPDPALQQQVVGDSPHSSHDPIFSSGHSSHSTPNSLTSVNTSKPVVAHLVETVGNLGGGVGTSGYSDRASVAATQLSYSREQRRQTDRLLEDVPPETDAYLIALFFQYGNSMLPIIDQEAFMHDKARGGSTSYSGFLHIILLAMGLRFADHSRPDVARYLLPNRENTLHKGARYLVEYELQCHGGVPSIQALLLLGDLEAACGKDNTGWMYGGMAIRLSFDMGLNLPPKQDLPAWELRNWRAALWACYIHDRYWSFYLGRPTSMKRSDIVASRLAQESQNLEDRIFSALIALMDLFTSITDNVEDTNKPVDDASYVFMTGLHRKLNIWYSELPLSLQWNATNIETAPASFFLLHQQYHSSLILLHRPLAQYNNASLHEDHIMYHLALVSRTICFENAMKVAQIFARLRLRFDIRKIYFSAVQHAGTAATALINGLSLIESSSERINPLQHLQTLYKALQDMSPIYQPADRMSTVLSHGFVVARWNTKDCPIVSTQGQQKGQPVSQRTASKRSMPLESSQPVDSPPKRRRENDISPGNEAIAEVDSPPGQFDSRQHDDTSIDIMFRTDFRDAGWEAMAQLSPLIPNRANFLDMTSGFDQLFQLE